MNCLWEGVAKLSKMGLWLLDRVIHGLEPGPFSFLRDGVLWPHGNTGGSRMDFEGGF